ncbi:MAG: hypothetical protein PHR68_01715 [Candidatus Gracilibacteria bacterium]|nr:hypothetical protein [Candidatus Gracilibacteria bacterium]
MKKYILSVFFLLSFIYINTSFAETPTYINNIINNTNSHFYELNQYGEFKREDGLEKKISSYNCTFITSRNYSAFKDTGYILKNYEGNYCFTYNISPENKIYYKDSSSYFTVLNYDLPVKLENNIYYAYKYSKYFYFEDTEGFFMSDFERFGYTKDNIIILKNKDKYYIIKDFKKIKLFNKSFISNITNKIKFLQTVYDDVQKSDIKESDILINLSSMKSYAEKIKDDDNDYKIQNIYKYLIDRTSYYTGSITGDLIDNSVFSGIYTYKNKVGVCDGYVKEMFYLLMFAGIENVDIKRGFVINSDLFPNVGHAWLKIGNYYYDPTFEDPIGSNKIKTLSDYKYFKLPYDVIYIDRFNAKLKSDIPSNILNLSLQERENLVAKNFFEISKKYLSSDYLLLKPYINKIKLGFSYSENITINKAKKFLKYVEVNSNYSFYDDNGNTKYIKNILYYRVTDSNLDRIMNSLYSYETNGIYLMKWNLGNGIYEYRLSNNITYY